MKNKGSKILAVLLIAMVILVGMEFNLQSHAQAAQDMVRITKSWVNIRSSASLKSSVIKVVPMNSAYTFKGQSGDFYQINFNGRNAYVHNSVSQRYTQSASSGQVIGKVTITVSVGNIRNAASLTSSRVIGSGYRNQSFEVIGTSGSFYKINFGKTTAYVHNTVVKYSSTGGSKPSPSDPPKGDTVIGKATIDVRTVANIRSGASLSSGVIGKGYPGQVYDVIAKSGDFYKIKLSSTKTAYVHNTVVKYSSTGGSKPSPSDPPKDDENMPKDPPPVVEDKGKVRVNVSKVANVRSKPTLSTDTVVVGTVKAGEQFPIVDFEGEFFKISTPSFGQVYIHKSVVVYLPPKDEGGQLPPFSVIPGSLKGKTVILDAGHGGHSPGAVNFGYLEKDYVLPIALRTEALLKQAGANVIMTRSSDVYVGLFTRSAIANKYVMGLEKAKRQKDVDDNRTTAATLVQERDNLIDEKANAEQQRIDNQVRLGEINTDEIPGVKQEILGSQAQLEAAEGAYAQAKDDRDAAQQALDEYLQNMERGEGELPGEGGQDEERERLEALLADAQAILQQVEKELQESQQALGDLNDQLSNLKATAAQLEESINQYPQQISAIQDNVDEKNQELAQLEEEYLDLMIRLNRAKDLEKQCADYIASGSDSRTGIYATAKKEDLEEMFEIEKAYQGDVVFVSIHMNATGLAQNTTRRGVQAFYFQGNSYYGGYDVSKRRTLANKLYNSVHPAMGLPVNYSPINTENFSVLRENNLAAVLLELGYMDNIYDLQELIKDNTHEKAARGICQGLVDYFN